MLTIVLLMGVALLSTAPSVLIARIYLNRRGLKATDGTVKTFMEVAPTPMKVVVITLNFVSFGAVCGAWWFLRTLLGS